MFNHMGGAVPVGLAMNAVGAHPIESWMSPDMFAACNVTTPCKTDPNSKIYDTTIMPMQPFTFGTMIWDQGTHGVSTCVRAVCVFVSARACINLLHLSF